MTFLFDIGRVLLDFEFESLLASLLPPGDAQAHARLAVLLERKDEFETGAIGPDAFIAWALEVLGSAASPDEFRHAWRDVFTPNLAMWQTVRSLAAAGHRLILFSNTNALHCPWAFDTFPDFSLFHAAVLSFEVGAIKPEPGIYQHAIAAHHLDPAATRYIDDLAENIAAGRAHGFRCFQYDLANHPAFQLWLRDELAYA
jgi:HAD superfamily hydrolase (TIGR01509 family)